MKKQVVLMALASAVFVGSIGMASAQQTKPTAAPTKIKCAVETGDTVDIKAATAAKQYADYKGNRYFFCCSDCPQQFKANPAKYAKNAHIKTPPAPTKGAAKK